MAAAMTPFAAASAGSAMAPQAGYSGLQGIIQALSGGINAGQYGNLVDGANGADGLAVGGMHGAFQGLSPFAVHFLATSGLLDKAPAATVPTTNADGTPLTGTALLMANLQNQLNAGQPAKYQLAQGVTAQNLASLFAGGIGGHSAYAHGYGADGRVGAGPGNPTAGPPVPPGQGPIIVNRNHGGGNVYSRQPVGYGLNGGAFHSLAAYHASKAYRLQQRQQHQGGRTGFGTTPVERPL